MQVNGVKFYYFSNLTPIKRRDTEDWHYNLDVRKAVGKLRKLLTIKYLCVMIRLC